MIDPPEIIELCDRIEWATALFNVRVAGDDATRAAATEKLIEAHVRIASAPQDSSRHRLMQDRLGLSETELQVVWMLAAFAIDSSAKNALLSQTAVGPALTLETLRRVIYGERPSLESFTGVCLLTSNHESNIDPAFQRRLSLHLRFDLPEVEERVRLWHSMLSTAAPVAADIDLNALARRYELSGGSIRNAALRAAFFAADKKTPVTMQLLERAARLEYEALGKIPL